MDKEESREQGICSPQIVERRPEKKNIVVVRADLWHRQSMKLPGVPQSRGCHFHINVFSF